MTQPAPISGTGDTRRRAACRLNSRGRQHSQALLFPPLCVPPSPSPLPADPSTSTTMLALPARIFVTPTLRATALGPLSRHVSSPPCFRRLHTPTSSRIASLRLPSRRCFASSPPSRSPEPSSSASSPVSESKPTQESSAQPKANSPTRSIWSRFLPSNTQESGKSASSFRKIAALALPEKKPLGIAIGLLLVSSTVSMSVPFTIGKLIDYFSTVNPVCLLSLFQRSAVQISLNALAHAWCAGDSIWLVDRASLDDPPPHVHGRRDCQCRAHDAYAASRYVSIPQSILRPGPWRENATDTGVLQVSGSSHGYGNGRMRRLCARRSSLWRRARVTC